ncbi:MAG: gliding motility protein, partial [Myxococcaceae bacterium]
MEELLKLYDSRSYEVSSSEAAGLLTKAGELARDRLKNVQRAEEFLRRALLLASDPSPALHGLKGLYEQRQDFGALAETLEKLGAATSGVNAAVLFMRAADLFENKLSRKDRAVIAAQRAIRADNKQRDAYRLVRRMFLGEGRFTSALDSLDRERLALGPEGLADEYGSVALQLGDDPSQLELAHRAADIALNLNPEQKDALAAKKAVETIEQTWRDRVRTLRTASLEERDRKKAARMSLVVARLYAWFDEKAGAAKVKEALDRCFLLWPGMPEALALVERMAERKKNPQLALDFFAQQISQVRDRTAQVDIWLRIGLIRISALEDREGALKAFSAAAAADPSRGDASSLAAELLMEDGRAADGVAVLEKHLATLKDKWAQVALRMRLADLCGGRGAQPEKAIEHLDAVLKLEPYNAEAAFRLARFAAEAEDEKSLAPYFELATFARRPLSERVALCESVSMLLEEKGDEKGAFLAQARALELSPLRPGAVESVLELAQKSNALEQAAVSLRKAAEGGTNADAAAAANLWKALAKLLSGDESKAAWEQVAKLLPQDSDAAAALQAIAAAVEAPPDERTLLEREAKTLESSGGNAERLAEIYRRLLEQNPHDDSVLRRLGAAYASMSRWDEVAKVAALLCEHSQTKEEKLEWTARLASLYADRLDRKEEAAKLYLQHFEQAGATPATTAALEKLQSSGVMTAEISRALGAHFAMGGDPQRLVAALLVQLSTATGKEEQKRILLQLASAHEQKLADRRAAFGFMLRALAIEPEDETVREFALETAREMSAQVELARTLLELGSKSSGAAGLALSLAAASIAEEGDSSELSASALEQALTFEGENLEVLARLGALWKSLGRLADAEGLLRKRIQLASRGSALLSPLPL